MNSPNPPRRDRYGHIDKSAPDDADYPHDWTPDQRTASSWAKIKRFREDRDRARRVGHQGQDHIDFSEPFQSPDESP